MEEIKRLKLTGWQTIWHYAVVLYILVFPLIVLFSLFEIHVTGTYNGVKTSEELLSDMWPSAVLVIVIYVIRRRQLRYKEVNIEYTAEEFQEAIQRTAWQCKWRVELDNERCFRAYRTFNWTASWGEMISIVKDENRLLLNSICNPNERPTSTSFGWNRRNIKTFLKNLTDVKNGIPFRTESKRNTKESPLTRMVVRLFAYPFCLFLIGFGSNLILNAATSKAAIAGFVAMAAALVYLYSDIKMIEKHRKRRARRKSNDN